MAETRHTFLLRRLMPMQTDRKKKNPLLLPLARTSFPSLLSLGRSGTVENRPGELRPDSVRFGNSRLNLVRETDPRS